MGIAGPCSNVEKIAMGKIAKSEIERLFSQQLDQWTQARDNYRALEQVEQKSVTVNGLDVFVQFNPARIVSSGAKVDAKTIRTRKCFLCEQNRPEVQWGIDFESTTGRTYQVLLNPFPIFPRHLTIPDRCHTDQRIAGRIADMLELAAELDDFVLFYNGPKCGASAPDHMHFQAGNKGFLPLEVRLDEIPRRDFLVTASTRLSLLESFVPGCFVIETRSAEEAVHYFGELYRHLPVKEGEIEPMMNLLCWVSQGGYRLLVLTRRQHRPDCYYAEGEDNILLSPASVDLGGVFITPLQKDFEKISAEDLAGILDQVCSDKEGQEALYAAIQADFCRFQPTVAVGIMNEAEVRVNFEGTYVCGDVACTGDEVFVCQDNQIAWRGSLYDELLFAGSSPADCFWLKDVTIGVNFHWERKEDQKFAGDLKLIVEGGRLTAVNRIGVEDYLLSVISSEMSATASKNLLKAHAVISRSWLMAQWMKNRALEAAQTNYCSCMEDEHSRIKWYDREDHTNFDVCADDHCQRYQGLTRASSPVVAEVIAETWGETLMHEGRICDARFSKCCGGVFEEFQNCWEPVKHPYLVKVRDSEHPQDIPDLTQEDQAREWILGSAEAFCNTTDTHILSQVLNNYDQETKNFYRWTQAYDQAELSELIRNRSGIDFGQILDLIPVERGTSGRLVRLKIVGTKRTMVIGKELEIRRTLSTSHLYSSAFVVEKQGDQQGVPARFILHGAGWGHGVGLCQIGAAVMGEQGYTYDQILLHYFVGAAIECRY